LQLKERGANSQRRLVRLVRNWVTYYKIVGPIFRCRCEDLFDRYSISIFVSVVLILKF